MPHGGSGDANRAFVIHEFARTVVAIGAKAIDFARAQPILRAPLLIPVSLPDCAP